MLPLITSVGPSPNTKKSFFDYEFEMMNYYQQQKLQYYWQSHYQNSMNPVHQMLFLMIINRLILIIFLTNLTVLNKQFLSGRLYVGLRDQLFSSCVYI